MDVLESRIPRPGQPDHGLYVWPQNIYLAEQLEHFRKAQASVTLGALARGVIGYEAAVSFMESGLHEEVEGLPVIPGEHVSTALGVFEREAYSANRRALLQRGIGGIATTLLLKRHFSSEQVDTARQIADKIDVITPIMYWVNADGYLATRGDNGALTIEVSPYNIDEDRQKYEDDERSQLPWEERYNFVMEHAITHVACRYKGYIDSASNPLPLLPQPPDGGRPRTVQELGWLINGVFEPATTLDPNTDS